MIFVFGSNTGGIHGAGAARTAYKEHGARWGMGYGHYGDSFAIPTKGHVRFPDKTAIGNPLDTLIINQFVKGFLAYARTHPELTFKITRIGCGLAGFKDEDIAVMFTNAPSNCQFDSQWAEFLPAGTKFWGHF